MNVPTICLISVDICWYTIRYIGELEMSEAQSYWRYVPLCKTWTEYSVVIDIEFRNRIPILIRLNFEFSSCCVCSIM